MRRSVIVMGVMAHVMLVATKFVVRVHRVSVFCVPPFFSRWVSYQSQVRAVYARPIPKYVRQWRDDQQQDQERGVSQPAASAC